MQISNLEEVIAAVSSSKKYHNLCPDTIRNIAERELANQGSQKAAIKATKRRLHQIYGAFELQLDYQAAYSRLEKAYRAGSVRQMKAVCQDLMRHHSSTRERLAVLDSFYREIFAMTGQPGSILDLGCGMNPLALPWMELGGLPDKARTAGFQYLAFDIDAARVRFLNQYLALAGLEPRARCQDILVHPPQEQADLAFLFKMSPTLERLQPGSTFRLLQQLRTPHKAVSFAVKSLAGRDKGMIEQYQRWFSELAQSRGWQVHRLIFPTELVFVVRS